MRRQGGQGGKCGGKEVNDDASLDTTCRCHPAACWRRVSLRSSSERSVPLAFAWSVRSAAEYHGPKDRRGGSRHRAGGEPQAGLSTASLKQDYQQRIAAAAPSDKERILNEAINALTKAVTDQGLSVEEYDSILEVAQNDPDVLEK